MIEKEELANNRHSVEKHQVADNRRTVMNKKNAPYHPKHMRLKAHAVWLPVSNKKKKAPPCICRIT